MPSEPKPGTPLPWKWTAEDDSLMSLVGPNDDFDHVLSSQKCNACNGSKRACLQPSEQDAAYIVHACNTLAELQKPCVWMRVTDPSDYEYFKIAVYQTTCGNSIHCVKGYVPKYCSQCGHPIQEVTEE